MSKGQRACDFCRSRKSACQIDTAPPCRLCIGHSKSCTFTGVKVRRNAPQSRRQLTATTVPKTPSAVPAEPSVASPAIHFAGPQLEDSNGFHLDSQDWNEFFFTDIGETASFDTPFDSSITGEQPRSNGLSAPSNIGRNSDEVMGDFHPRFFEEIFKESPQPQTEERSLDQLGEVTAELCGLTGDMDPYLLRRYRFNENAEFGFSKLSIRTVQDTTIPAQFLLSPTDLSSHVGAEAELQDSYNSDRQDDEREKLAELIPLEIGARLVQL